MPIPYAPSAARKEVEEHLRHVADVLRKHAGLDADWTEPVNTGFVKIAARADELRERYGEPFRLAVVGEFNAGKSALINALVGRPGLVPEGVTATTGCVTEVWWAETDAARVLDGTGTEVFAGTPAEAVLYADQRRAQGKQLTGQGARVILGIAEDFLKNLVILDTPGLGSNDRDDRATLDSLHLADAALLVVNGLQPGGAESLMLSEILRTTQRRFITVVTRIDKRNSAAEALATAKDVFGDVADGDPIGVNSPGMLAALLALRAGEEDRDEAAIATANEALTSTGYMLLRERLQDSLFAEQARAPRSVSTLAEINAALSGIRLHSAKEAGRAQVKADAVSESLSAEQRRINDVLRPKIPYLAAKIDEAVDIHVGEFISDLSDAVDVYIDQVADGGLGLGFRSLAAKFSDKQAQRLKERLGEGFDQVFPKNRLDITVARITRTVETLMEYEWHEAVVASQSADDPKRYEPSAVVDQVVKHVTNLSAALAAQMLGWIAVLLIPGGIVFDAAFTIFAVATGAAATESRKANSRLEKAKRLARTRIRSERHELSFKLSERFRDINKATAERLIDRANQASTQKQAEAAAVLAQADRWRGAAADMASMVELGEEYATGSAA